MRSVPGGWQESEMGEVACMAAEQNQGARVLSKGGSYHSVTHTSFWQEREHDIARVAGFQEKPEI